MAPLEPNAAENSEKAPSKDELITKGKDSFTEGKRLFLANDFPAACKKLSEACELLAKNLEDDYHVECADPYFYYGRSLLELARLEPGVFTNALDGMPDESSTTDDDSAGEGEEEEGAEKSEEKPSGAEEKEKKDGEEQCEDVSKLTEEEREELHELVEEALEENAESLEKGTLPTEAEVEAELAKEAKEEEEEAAPAEEAKEEEGKPEEAEETTEEPAEGVEEPEAEEGEGAEVSNIQLAWEMLDLARIIYEKQTGEEWRRRLAECLQALGEVSVEDSNYGKGVEDFRACLALQETFLPENDRFIASTYFLIGRAENLANNFEEATTAFRKARDLIDWRIGEIKKRLEKQEDLTEEGRRALEAEGEDLASLLPDVEAKIEDNRESKAQAAVKAMMEQAEEEEGKKEGAEAGATTTAVGFDAPSKKRITPAAAGDPPEEEPSDIGHLVRKPLKRKDEEGPGQTAEEIKRAKTEETATEGGDGGDAVNGHAQSTANGHSAVAANGDAKAE